MYDKSTVYIIGHGKTSSENAITSNFKIFFIGLVIDTKDDIVVDMECSATISITSRFISDMFIGKSFAEYDPQIEEDIKKRYYGTSQKALVTAYKDAVIKYREIKEKYY